MVISGTGRQEVIRFFNAGSLKEYANHHMKQVSEENLTLERSK
jgi:hypothetical protein